MIDLDDIRKAVESYLECFPSERTRQADLLERVLHVHHRTLGRWLRPGGHLEPEDTSLLGAAVREAEEELVSPG